MVEKIIRYPVVFGGENRGTKGDSVCLKTGTIGQLYP